MTRTWPFFFAENIFAENMDLKTQVIYIRTVATTIINDVQPKAVMTDEVARWNELPADEQLARLRAALQRGIDSGPADVTMDRIWAKIRARHPDAKL
jgi:hypothetical protein